jgi:predicted acetyltransferase
MGKKPPQVYAFGDPAEAYLWVTLTEFWGDVSVGEFAWATPRGYESGLAFLAGLAANQTTVTWCEPPDGPALSRFLDQGVQLSLYRPTMFRVVDVSRALGPFVPAGVSLRVVDPLAPWNDGVWRLDDRIERRDQALADVTVPVESLAQLVMGQRSARHLCADGLLESSSAGSIEILDRCFPSRPVVCMDFF